ncbi:LamG-like jellyroll fold domain-containing protein [Botrimarina hoheduenensis]|nr:LamG-like jellyroll fold domain-containing protein [Botrimarina hoheduenensis]
MPASARAGLLVHYTFDNADISGATLIDSAGGNNNGLLVGQVEAGVPGVLGQAIRLPNDDGLSYGLLSSSLNPAPTGNDPRTIAFWFSQEQQGVENKMFGYGRSNTGQSFDVSLEGGGIRLRYSGGNVTWGSGFDFTGASAGFHHLAIRVPSGAVDYLDIDVFLDGVELPATPTGGNPGATLINTSGGMATNLNLGRSPAFDPAGDFIGLLDDFRLYDTALNDAEIGDLASAVAALVIDVDPTSGGIAIRNPSDQPIALGYYELTSASGALSPTGWASLQAQDRSGFGAATGLGDGWERLGTPSSNLLAEGYLSDESVLGPGQSLPLGAAYNPFFPLDLELTYQTEGVFRSGRLGEVGAVLAGDYNDDGLIDVADYTVWRDAVGTPLALHNDSTPTATTTDDYAAWVAAWQASSAAQTIPEPTGLRLLIIFCSAGLLKRVAV